MAVSELVKAVAIESANDAAVALAEHVAGSEPAFVALMNERAQVLGCKNTHFINATGLPGSSHAEDCVSSARDVAIMSRELLKHPQVHEWLTIWIGYVRDGKNMLTNTNRLIRFYPGADGIKTGYTARSKYCLSATAVRNNVRVIGVVLGVPPAHAVRGIFNTARLRLQDVRPISSPRLGRKSAVFRCSEESIPSKRHSRFRFCSGHLERRGRCDRCQTGTRNTFGPRSNGDVRLENRGHCRRRGGEFGLSSGSKRCSQSQCILASCQNCEEFVRSIFDFR